MSVLRRRPPLPTRIDRRHTRNRGRPRTEAIDDLPVEQKVRDLLHFVRRINLEAFKITDAHLAQLRGAGWTDQELVEATWTACLFNGIVRLADTFGLYTVGQLAPQQPGESVWQR